MKYIEKGTNYLKTVDFELKGLDRFSILYTEKDKSIIFEVEPLFDGTTYGMEVYISMTNTWQNGLEINDEMKEIIKLRISEAYKIIESGYIVRFS